MYARVVVGDASVLSRSNRKGVVDKLFGFRRDVNGKRTRGKQAQRLGASPRIPREPSHITCIRDVALNSNSFLFTHPELYLVQRALPSATVAASSSPLMSTAWHMMGPSHMPTQTSLAHVHHGA